MLPPYSTIKQQSIIGWMDQYKIITTLLTTMGMQWCNAYILHTYGVEHSLQYLSDAVGSQLFTPLLQLQSCLQSILVGVTLPPYKACVILLNGP